jgi:uncharacterized metal-binding protein YceD (DUF177 family)
MQMSKFDAFNVDLKGMKNDFASYEYQLDNIFFSNIDAPEIQKGNVKVTLDVKRVAQVYELNIHSEGIVIVLCDRCLDEMEQPVVSDDKLKVKLGEKYAEEGDDIVIVPEKEGTINLAWFLYEFVSLAIPMRHIHPAGKCNKQMMGHLKKHLVTDSSEDSDTGEQGEIEDDEINNENNIEDQPYDSRWDELKKLKK